VAMTQIFVEKRSRRSGFN